MMGPCGSSRRGRLRSFSPWPSLRVVTTRARAALRRVQVVRAPGLRALEAWVLVGLAASVAKAAKEARR